MSSVNNTFLAATPLTLASHARHPQGHQAAVRLGEEYATQARRSVNTDEPSIDALQTLLLLVIAFVASGKGKKAHMLTCTLPVFS